MIEEVRFSRYRGFARFKAGLAPHAYLVGPNSAGKSTIVETIALADRCVRQAARNQPTISVTDRNQTIRAHPLPREIAGSDDPIRYDFGTETARASVVWSGGAALHMVWPEDRDEAERGYFWLEGVPSAKKRSLATLRSQFPAAMVVPVITPLDHSEELKNDEYVRRSIDTRLASRHFRNHLLTLSRSAQWSQFIDYIEPWLPEIQIDEVRFDAGADRIGVFYTEPGSRVPKELSWAGDGVQIWLQLLWHLYRAAGAATVVLDEPEVYMHPDLQRRLVRVLEGMSSQVVLATHSTDVITEAPAEHIVWVDRRTSSAKRADRPGVWTQLSATLGSAYNLALARSMRARLLVAVQGAEPKTFRLLARSVGASRIYAEQGVAITGLRDRASWGGTEGLRWVISELLAEGTPLFVVLAGGHTASGARQRLLDEVNATGAKARLLSRPDVDSYLLNPALIARASGAAPEAIEREMRRIDDELLAIIKARVSDSIAAWGERRDEPDLRELRQLEETWAVPSARGPLRSGELWIPQLNEWLEHDGYSAISAPSLARHSRALDIPAELESLLLEIDALAER